MTTPTMKEILRLTASDAEEAMTTPTPCDHDANDKDTAIYADGLCPYCLQRDLAAAQQEACTAGGAVSVLIEQLADARKELLQEKSRHNATISRAESAQSALAAAQEALAKAEKDAARYRYLRGRDEAEVWNNYGVKAGVWIDYTDEDDMLLMLTFEDADIAIDAAIDAIAEGK